MPTEAVAKETVLISLENKLAIREAQLKLANAKEAIHTAIANAQQMDKDVVVLLNDIAKKLNLSVEEYIFNADNLTFQPK